MIVVIIGPPGAGKSSQSELLKDREHIDWLYVSKLLRSQNNPAIAKVMDEGRLVDDDVVNRLVAGYIEKIDAGKVVVIDGFPRHLPQAKWLVEFARQSRRDFAAVIHLDIPRSVSEQRLQLRGRDDDTPAVISQRLELYEHDIKPVLSYFQAQGIPIHRVSGDHDKEVVFAQIDKLLSDVHQG
jgi:adenylate kinase